jgi:acetyl esterase/lipase
MLVALVCLLQTACNNAPEQQLKVELEGHKLDPVLAEYLQSRFKPDEFAAKRAKQKEMLLTEKGRIAFRRAVDKNWIDRTRKTSANIATTEVSIATDNGVIKALVLTPTDASSKVLPILIYWHGGGWLFSSKEAVTPAAEHIADVAQAIVVVPEYRQSPEYKYPAAHIDALATFQWVTENAEALGGVSQNVAVGGDSAGGNMAVSIAMRQQENKGVMPSAMFLNYPVLDLNVKKYASYETYKLGYGLDQYFVDMSTDLVLSDVAQTNDPFASPLLADDLSQMPATVIATAGFDMLRDQGRDFAARLRESKVDVHYFEYNSLIHGYMQFTDVVEDADKATTEAAQALKSLLY